MISITALVLVISIDFLVLKAAAQSDKYSKMALVDQYLMDRNAEILLEQSAARIPYPATRVLILAARLNSSIVGQPEGIRFS